jgi:hypothetical protein
VSYFPEIVGITFTLSLMTRKEELHGRYRQKDDAERSGSKIHP